MKTTEKKVTKIVIEQFMIDLIKAIYGKDKPLTYAEYAKHMTYEFGVTFTERDVWLYFEPTAEEEELDLRLNYANTVE